MAGVSTTYFLGDHPDTPLPLIPTRDGEPIDLDRYLTVSASLQQPNGTTAAASPSLVDGELAVGLPVLAVAGLSWLLVTLATGDGHTDRLDPVPVIVQDFDGWHTIGSARAEWRDAKDLEDRRLYTLLQVAKAGVLAYAPALGAGTLPPISYREAQLLHARNTLNAGRVDPATGDNGGAGFALTPFPLDWSVKQLLRPQQGLKRVR